MPLSRLQTGPILPGVYRAARDEYDRGLQGYQAIQNQQRLQQQDALAQQRYERQEQRQSRRDALSDQRYADQQQLAQEDRAQGLRRYEDQLARQDRRDQSAQESAQYQRDQNEQEKFWGDYDRIIGKLNPGNKETILSNYNKALDTLKKRHPSMANVLAEEEVDLANLDEASREQARDEVIWKTRYALSVLGIPPKGVNRTDLDKRIELAQAAVQGDAEAAQVLDLITGGDRDENERIILALIRGYYEESGPGGSLEGQDIKLSNYVLNEMAQLKQVLDAQENQTAPQGPQALQFQEPQRADVPDWRTFAR